MNIVTPILNAIAYPTANVNTESARRDNVQRETIPQASDSQQGASQKGLGSETDKAKSPGQPPAPVTYERPQIQTELQAAFQNVFGQEKDNAQDESAGKQDAKDRQQQQQEKQEASEIEQLKARDQEVRVHEQAMRQQVGSTLVHRDMNTLQAQIISAMLPMARCLLTSQKKKRQKKRCKKWNRCAPQRSHQLSLLRKT